MTPHRIQILAVAAVALFVQLACSDSGDVSVPTAQLPARNVVEFSTYLGRSAVTRAGAVGPINTEKLKESGYGFGVFATNTRLSDFRVYRQQRAAAQPTTDVMNNEHIGWSQTEGKWAYQDGQSVRYWPAEPTDAQVSFFAYAPYVAAPAVTDTAGIIRLDVSAADPCLDYRLSADNSRPVDLLWGTAGSGGERLLPEQRFPVNTDLTWQTTQGTVGFLFKHALAKMGGPYQGGDGNGSDDDQTTLTHGLMIMLDIDKREGELGGTLQRYAGPSGVDQNTKYNTKVTVNSIRLECSRQLTEAGRQAIKDSTGFDYDLHTEPLYNTARFNLATGQWTDWAYTPSASPFLASQTIKPLHAEAAETGSAVLHPNIAEPATGWDNAHTEAAFRQLPIGVTTVPKNVFQGDADAFYFIPGTHPVIDITVDYTVRTFDEHLSTAYTEVRQAVMRRLCIVDDISLNKHYNILIHIGLTSVKFTATVADWDGPATMDNPVDTYSEEIVHVYLPSNV